MSTANTLTPTAVRPTLLRRQILTAGALSVMAVGLRSSPAIADATAADVNPEISSTGEAIHQERTFKARRERVYNALTVESQFDKIIQLSGVMKADVMAKMHKPTKLSPDAGSAFSLFGGYIVGRQIELIPSELIVQAWRVQSWPRGIYSIARFELSERGGSTKLVFDHTSFPQGYAEHLASGWQEHYWDPLSRFLA